MTKNKDNITTANQYERIIWLHNKMQTSSTDYNEYNWKFDKSKRTFNRDIENLKYNFGAPIQCNDSQYTYIDETFTLPALLLSEKELYGLAISSYVVEAYKETPIYQSLKKVMKRLSDLLSDEVNYIYLENNTKVENIRDFNWENIVKISKAMSQNKVINMEYSSFNSNKKSRRKVDPCYIYNWKGEFYFVGWCHKRKAFRDFFIGRIDDLEITSIKATNHDFNADTYFSDKLWGILKGGEEVKVKFKVKEDRVAWVNERFGDRIEKIDERDDWVFFSVDVVVNKDFVKWVLGWGEDIMVLSPTAVQERLVDYCKGVLGLYDKVSRKDT